MKKPPTKQQIKAARAKMKRGRALLTQARRVLFRPRLRRHRMVGYRPPSKAEQDFRTWQHDVDVILPALSRSADLLSLTPTQLVDRAAFAADRMASEIADRKPSNVEGKYRRRAYDGSKMGVWRRWQIMFDGLVHHLSEMSDLDASDVVDRAASLADTMSKVIEKRRLALKKK